MNARASEDKVCVAAVAGAHGVRGMVRLKCFTAAPEDVAAYGPVSDESGTRTFRVSLKGAAKGVLLAQLSGVETREQAEALKGTRLYVSRDVLPEVEDEDDFYHADLIGLRAERPDGAEMGTITAVHDFGAGPLLDIRLAPPARKSVLVPFTKAAVPVVDLKAGRVVVDLPDGLADEADQPRSAEKAAAGAARG